MAQNEAPLSESKGHVWDSYSLGHFLTVAFDLRNVLHFSGLA